MASRLPFPFLLLLPLLPLLLLARLRGIIDTNCFATPDSPPPLKAVPVFAAFHAQEFARNALALGHPALFRGLVRSSMPDIAEMTLSDVADVFLAAGMTDLAVGLSVLEGGYGAARFLSLPVMDFVGLLRSEKALRGFRKKWKADNVYWAEQSELDCFQARLRAEEEDDDGDEEEEDDEEEEEEEEIDVPSRLADLLCPKMNFLPHVASQMGSLMSILDVFFWIGPKSALTGLHFDLDSVAFLHQVVGRKEIWLFPPDQTEFLYPNERYEPGGRTAAVNPFEPDLVRFPEFEHAQGLYMVLEPGDALFVPSRWWHAVRSLDVTVSFAGRTERTCSSVTSSVHYLFEILHRNGLYHSWDDCTCHDGTAALDMLPLPVRLWAAAADLWDDVSEKVW